MLLFFLLTCAKMSAHSTLRIPDREQLRLSPLCRVKLKFRSVPVVNNTAADINIRRFNPLSKLGTEVKDV